MNKKNKINEATLEARISRVLKEVFPTFKEVNVIHQKSFSIKFGHHEVSVNLKEPSKYPSRAILDILLTVDGENVMLLELKKEGHSLTSEDVDQGISYARLTHPITPITLISNGTNNLFYNTYTKEKLDKTEVDLEFIQNLTNSSFNLALNDFKNAIDLLLNREYDLFSQIINQISETRFNQQSGMLYEFSKPICHDFRISREVMQKIQSHFSKKAPLVGIIGSAFSGKTNLLYQFFEAAKSNTSFLLYMDCKDYNYSILQQLANQFTKITKNLISKDKIREWLINALNTNNEAKFYLLLDNFNNEIPEEIKNEIIELVDIFSGINHYTLYTTDEFNYKQIAFVKNRQYKTLIGEKSKIVKLDELNDKEYEVVRDYLFKKYSIVIDHGGHYTPEYREPRILRHLTYVYHDNIEKGQHVKIIAVPDLAHLHALSQNKIYSKEVHDLYRKIAFCFLMEQGVRKKDLDFSIVAMGSGAITNNSFKKYFPEELEKLIQSSFVVLRQLRNGITVIYPTIPELIANYSIRPIAGALIKMKGEGKEFKDICRNLIEIITPVPYCDIVATGVLMEIANQNRIELFSALVQELIQIPPSFGKVKDGTTTLMYSKDIGHIQIDFNADMEEGGFVSNFLPYAILSQLAGYPLSLAHNEEYSQFAFHQYLLYTVGSNKKFLRRADARSLKNMKPLSGYDWDGIGYIVSGKEGIVEPIVQSIQKCFIQIPEEITILYNRAFEEKNFALLWRIYLALRTMVDYSDRKLSDHAKRFLDIFNDYFKNFMAEFLSKDIKDPDERAILIKTLLNKV